jgi:acetyl esterase/lipase
VVWFHGGGITGGHRSVPVPLRNQGVIVVSANYRLSPNVKAPVYIEDAAAAVSWALRNVEKFGGSADRVFVSGHSAGRISSEYGGTGSAVFESTWVFDQ